MHHVVVVLVAVTATSLLLHAGHITDGDQTVPRLSHLGVVAVAVAVAVQGHVHITSTQSVEWSGSIPV